MNDERFDGLLKDFLSVRATEAPILRDEPMVVQRIAARSGGPGALVRRGVLPRPATFAALVAVLVSLIIAAAILIGSSGPSMPRGLIAFDSGGDIWVVGADGGGLRQLTFDAQGRGRDWGPAWSPDGSMLAYTRDGSGSEPAAILVTGADGHPIGTVFERRPREWCTCWTDDPGWSAADFRASWAPDDRRIAFSWWAPRGYGIHQVFVGWLTGQEPEVYPGGLPQGSGPAWSQHGDLIAYVSWPSVAVHIVASDGADDRVVSRSGGDRVGFVGPRWSPDGMMVAYAVGTDGAHDIALADADGTGERIASRPGDELWPVWSPDGSRIAFVSDVNDVVTPMVPDGPRVVPAHDVGRSKTYRLTVVDVATDGGVVRTLDPADAVPAPPVWSPDGSRLAFWVRPSNARPSAGLMVVDLLGAAEPVLIPAESETYGASWQPVP